MISTRGKAPKASFADVLLAGLAPDGGLYLPEFWPQFTPPQIASFGKRAYSDAAREIISTLRRRLLHERRNRERHRCGLCHVRRRWRRAACRNRARPVPDGAVSRSDARLQGHGDAGARAAVLARARKARRTGDGRVRHIGRHGFGRDRRAGRPAATSRSSSCIPRAASARCSAAR